MKENLKKLFQQRALVVSLGKVLSSLTGMLLPMYLARAMNIEEYGAYKQLLLVWLIGFQMLGMGIDHGLFYFVGKRPDKAPIYSLNVLIFNFVMALVLLLSLTPGISFLSHLIKNPSLVTYWIPLSFLILVSVPSQHFEHYLMLLGRSKSNMALQIGTETCKSLIIIISFYLTQNLAMVLWVLVLFYGLRTFGLLSFNYRLIRQGVSPLSWSGIWQELVAQFKFGIPMGISKISVSLMGMDKFIVSAFMGLKNFTFYAVGTMDLPLFPGVAYTYIDSMAMDMVAVQSQRQQIQAIWLDTLKKVFFILLIPIAYVIVFSEDFIQFFYGDKFSSAANLFRLGMVNCFISAFDFEIVYRVFNQSKKMAKLYFMYVASTLILVLLGASTGNIYYPILGKIICTFVYFQMVMKDFSSFFGIDVKKIIPWKFFLNRALSLVAIALLVYLVSKIILTGQNIWVRLMVSGLSYLALSWPLVLRKDLNVMTAEVPSLTGEVAH